jgi:hypothetical protein
VACSTIDDDLSNCGTNYQLDYQLQLVTNMTTELQTQLTTQTDVSVATAVRNSLSSIFTDYAHDVDLSFYDVNKDSARLQHDTHIMDDKQASYTLYLPMHRYMHLAVANLVENPMVSLAKDEYCHQSVLQQPATDTIASHTTGVFSARLQMDVLEGIDQIFNVHLYMANCAATLVIDPCGHDLKNLRVFSTGFANQFNIADSTYSFAKKDPIVRTTRIDNTENNQVAFTSVTFPSRNPSGTRTIIDTDEPFITPTVEDALWQFRIYYTEADGSITETLMGIHQPLLPGQLKVLKAYVGDDGQLHCDDQTVGISVVLHWNQGGQYEPEL